MILHLPCLTATVIFHIYISSITCIFFPPLYILDTLNYLLVLTKSTSWPYITINLILLKLVWSQMKYQHHLQTPIARKFQNSCRPDDPFPFNLIVNPSLRHSSKGKNEKPSTLKWKAEREEGQEKKKPKQWRWIFFCSAMTNLQQPNQGQICMPILQSGWE